MRLDELSVNNQDFNNIDLNPYISYQNKSYINQIKKSKKKRIITNINNISISNLEISQQYGQNNFEKGLILISILIVMNILSIILNISLITYSYLIILTVGTVIRLIIFIILVIIYTKFKKGEVFCSLSNGIFTSVDIFTTMNLLIINFEFLLSHFQVFSIVSWNYIMFIVIYMLSLYFSIITLKLFNYLSFSYTIQLVFKKILFFISYYLLCIEEEVQENTYVEYQEFDDFDSEY